MFLRMAGVKGMRQLGRKESEGTYDALEEAFGCAPVRDGVNHSAAGRRRCSGCGISGPYLEDRANSNVASLSNSLYGVVAISARMSGRSGL